MSVPASIWIRRFHAAHEARTRLVCLPHAGGSATYYTPISRALAPSVEVLAVQYPGRQDRHRERCIDSLPELAALVTKMIIPWADKPLTLFGHSMGATLGFEVARRLEAAGIMPSALFASGRRAPSRHREEASHLLSDADLIAEVRALNGTESQLLSDDEVVQMVLPAIRGDYRAAETYRYQPGPKLSCPIFALIGDNDPKVTVGEAQSWAEHTVDRFELRTFPGGHFYLNSQALAVIALVSKYLDSVTSVRG